MDSVSENPVAMEAPGGKQNLEAWDRRRFGARLGVSEIGGEVAARSVMGPEDV
jgi:hypothetical protein